MALRPTGRIRTAMILITALLTAALACSLPSSQGAELPDDGPPVAVSRGAAVSFVTKVIAIGGQASTSQSVRFTITQEEVTSALAYGSELAIYAQGGPVFEGLSNLEVGDLPTEDLPPQAQRFRQLAESLDHVTGSEEGGTRRLFSLFRLRLEEPQVYFKSDSRMIVRGVGRLARWQQPLRVVFAPRAEEGELELDFVDGQLGSLPLPEFLFDPLGELLSQALLAGQDYAAITELTVADGTLTFAGELRVPIDLQP